MSTQTVFNSEDRSEEKKEEVVLPEGGNVDAFADQLAQILNEEGKPKYKDVATALNALKSSQDYIPTLKQEKESLETQVAQLREELTKRSAIQEVVEQLKNKPAQEKEPEMENHTQSLTPEQIQEMLEQYVPQILEKRQEKSIAEKNIFAVDSKLKEFYGDKVEEAVKAKAEGLGLSIQDLEALSAKSPASALELLGVKETKQTGRTISSSVNVPPYSRQEENLKPDKSMLRGATGKEQAEYIRRIKESVLKQHGYTS